MTTFRKAIVIFYMFIVSILVAVPILDGADVIQFKDGTSWLLAQIVVATAVPVAIAVLKTADFFREDPIDIERINMKHSEEVAQHEKKYAQLHVEHTESKRKPISSLADIRIMEIIEDHKKK